MSGIFLNRLFQVSLFQRNKGITMKKKKRYNPPKSPLAAFHKGSREAEIEAYGKPVNHRKIVESKKIYKRSNQKRKDYE
jgi:hypothetical protein